jgi:hypothetical protein
MANPTAIDDLKERWKELVPPSRDDADAIAVMLTSQHDALTRSSTPEVALLAATFGPQWIDMVIRAYAKALLASNCFDMFSVQPVTEPVGRIAQLKPRYSPPTGDGDIPEIHLEMSTEIVAARSSGCRGRLHLPIDKPGCPPIDRQALLDTIVQTVIEERVRCVLGTLREQSAKDNVLELLSGASGDVSEAVLRAMDTVYRRTMRGPANNILAKPSALALLNDNVRSKALIHGDDLFPADEIMAWYNGPSLVDSVVVWAPFCFMFMAVDNVDEDGTRTRDLCITFRDSITVTVPAGVMLVPISNEPAII